MKVVVHCNSDLYDEGNVHPQSELTVMRIMHERGHDVSLFYAEDVFKDGERVRKINTRKFFGGATKDASDNYVFPVTGELEDMVDVVVLKKNYPDKALLKALGSRYEAKGTRVVNGTNMYETYLKTYCARFLKHMPDTTYSASVDELLAASKRYGTTILKPIDEGCGRGIRKVTWGEDDIRRTVDEMTDSGSQVIVAQRFLEEFEQGDKRILALVHEEGCDYIPISVRYAAPGSFLCNLHAGGTRSADAEITPEEMRILEAISPQLIEDRIFMGGLDFIGGKLIEINTINPGFTLSDTDIQNLDLKKRMGEFLEKFA